MRVIADGDLAELLTTGNNRKYKVIARTPAAMNGLKRAVEILLSVSCVEELSSFSFLHYERLKYEMKGLSSIRLSNRFVYRLIFKEELDKITLKLIEIDDTHYGNKK